MGQRRRLVNVFTIILIPLIGSRGVPKMTNCPFKDRKADKRAGLHLLKVTAML